MVYAQNYQKVQEKRDQIKQCAYLRRTKQDCLFQNNNLSQNPSTAAGTSALTFNKNIQPTFGRSHNNSSTNSNWHNKILTANPTQNPTQNQNPNPNGELPQMNNSSSTNLINSLESMNLSYISYKHPPPTGYHKKKYSQNLQINHMQDCERKNNYNNGANKTANKNNFQHIINRILHSQYK